MKKKFKFNRNVNSATENKYFKDFEKLVEEQLAKGRKKYFESDESTIDIISEFDPKFLLANIVKYAIRVSNNDSRCLEDLTKIAANAYIIWLKLDNHILIRKEK